MEDFLSLLQQGKLPTFDFNIIIEQKSIWSICAALTVAGTVSLGSAVFLFWLLMGRNK
jgi:hypothetical protein